MHQLRGHDCWFLQVHEFMHYVARKLLLVYPKIRNELFMCIELSEIANTRCYEQSVCSKINHPVSMTAPSNQNYQHTTLCLVSGSFLEFHRFTFIGGLPSKSGTIRHISARTAQNCCPPSMSGSSVQNHSIKPPWLIEWSICLPKIAQINMYRELNCLELPRLLFMGVCYLQNPSESISMTVCCL
jgi:hypothetical protein